jgi:hypothetical protein
MERVLYLLECAEYVFSYPKFVQYFLKRTLCLIYRIPFVNRMAVVHALAKMSIELTAIIFSLSKFSSSRLEKWRFVNQILLHIIKSNYFQNGQKSEYFLDDFEALVGEIDVRALVLQNHPKSIHTSARTSISRTRASKWPATA